MLGPSPKWFQSYFHKRKNIIQFNRHVIHYMDYLFSLDYVMEMENSTATNNSTKDEPLSPFDTTLITFGFSLSIVTFILHVGGVYLIFAVKRRPSTSTSNNVIVSINLTLLILLSFSETISGLFFIVSSVCWYMKQYIIHHLVLGLMPFSSGLSLSTIYVITINRLVATTHPFWYRSYITKKKFYVGLLCWNVVMVGLFGGSCIVFSLPDAAPITRAMGFGILSLIYLFYFFFCFFSYISIFWTIFKSRRNTETEVELTTVTFFWTTLKQGGYVVPLLITSTYLLFVAVPYLAMKICSYCYSGGECFNTAFQMWRITYYLNNITDALI